MGASLSACAPAHFGDEANAAPRCDVWELRDAEPAYNALVCEGTEAMEKRRYAEAASRFEAALSVPLQGKPNIDLFPRLALAYYMVGDRGKTEENLIKSERSLEVLLGNVRCAETVLDPYLSWDGLVPVSHRWARHADEIARLMCGASHRQSYENRTLESFVATADTVKRFLEVK